MKKDLEDTYFSPDGKILNEETSLRIKLLVVLREEGLDEIKKCLQDREIEFLLRYTKLEGMRFTDSLEEIGKDPKVYDRKPLKTNSAQLMAQDIFEILESDESERPWIGSDGQRVRSGNYKIIIKFKNLNIQITLTPRERMVYDLIEKLEDGRYCALSDIATNLSGFGGKQFKSHDVTMTMQAIVKKIQSMQLPYEIIY